MLTLLSERLSLWCCGEPREDDAGQIVMTLSRLRGEMVMKKESTEFCQHPKVNGILCFGDSLTQGFCFSQGQLAPYGDRLSQRFKGVTVVSDGLAGQTTSDLMDRLPELLAAGYYSSAGTPRPFDLVLILGGTNDLRFWHDKETIFRNLCALHTEVHRNNYRTAVITLPYVRSSSEQERVDDNRRWINASLREFAAQDPRQRLFIDLAAAIPQDDAHMELWDADGVHFSLEGYDAMSDVIGDAIGRFDRALGKGAMPAGDDYGDRAHAV